MSINRPVDARSIREVREHHNGPRTLLAGFWGRPPLLNQHGIAIAVESVSLFDGFLVRGANFVSAG